MATSGGADNKVQIVIEAKDVASDVLKKTGVSFGNLSKESTGLSKTLLSTGQALQVVVNYADLTRIKLTDTSVAIIGLGVATTGALGGAIAKLAGLTSVVGKIKEGVESPLAQTFIDKIQQAAEEATQELAPLSILLKEVSQVGANFGTGFTQKLFNLDSRTIAKQLDDGITLGVGRIGDKIVVPLKSSLGTFDNEGQKTIGRIAQRLDRELSKGIVDATFGLAIGKGQVQDIIKNIATNPAIAQYSPQFVKSLLSGSTAGAVDSLLLEISKQINKTQFSPLADVLGKSGLQNQIEVLANVKVNTTSVFTQIDRQIADAVLDQKIAQLLGKNVSTGLIKGILQNSAVKSILSGSIQDLVNGSFSDALIKVTQKGISAPLGNLFNLANTSLENIAYKSGARLANRLFDGLDPEIKKRNQRSRELLGSTFDGVGGKFTSGLGLGTNIPLISSARGGAVSGLLTGQLRNIITSALPAPALLVDQLINYSAITDSLFKAIGIKGQIPGLKQLDVVLGGVVAAGLGKAIDRQIPVILAPLVNNAADYITNRFKTAGTNAIASAATAFLPGYLKNVVKVSLLETGAAGFVFDALIENLKPTKLISNFAALDGVLANVKTNVNSSLTLVDTLLKGFRAGVAGIPSILGNTQSIINSLVASADSGLSKLSLDAVDFVVNFNQGLNQISGNIVNTLLDLSVALEDLRGRSPVGDSIIDTLQFGIQKAIEAVGFLQAKLKAIAGLGLQFTVGGIDSIRNVLQSFNNFSQNIIPNIKASITSIFSFISSGVASLDGGIQRLLAAASSGIESFKISVPSFLGQAFTSIDALKTALGGTFINIDNLLNTLKTSTTFGTTFAAQIQFVQDKFIALRSIADTSLSFIQTKVLGSSNLFVDFGNRLQSAISAVSSFSSGASTSIQSGLGRALSFVIGSIDTVIPSVVSSFTSLIDGAISGIGVDGSGGFGKIFNGAIDSARSVVATVSPIFNTIVTSIESNFGEAINFIRRTIGSIAGMVAENLGKIIGDFFKVDFSQFPPGLETIIDNLFGNVFSQLFGRIGQNANRAFLAGFFGAGFERISPAINAIDQSVLKIYNTLATLPGKIAGPIDAISKLPGAIAGFGEPIAVFGYLQEAVGGFAHGVSSVIERVAFFSQGLSSLQQFATTGPFQTLIGQNVELQQQLLSTQASLAATSKIYNGLTGQQLTDPTTAIKSLQAPISGAIDKLRVESLDLVGVTSKDLIPLYQQIAGQVTGIGGSLNDAKDLSLDFGASLSTLNIPLYQSRQEIGSILTATIDQNSVLAKSLNISNDQVNNWKAQGRLVEELRKKLAPFRSGNALAAQTLSGVTSNIQEIFDEIGRRAGTKLLDPLVEQITGVYNYLKANQSQFVAYFTEISDQILRVGLAVVDAAKSIFSSIGGLVAEAPLYLFKSLANGVEAVAEAIQFTVQVLGPAIRFMTELVQAAAPLGGAFLQSFVTLQALSLTINKLGSIFETLAQLVPGLGEIMFALDLRTQGVTNQFINLSQVLGTGGGGFLILGKYINEIPGAAEAATVALGPLGGLLVGFIPTIASIGIQVAGLIVLFPALGAFLSNLLTLTPALITAAGAFVTSNVYLAPLAPLFTQAADAVGLYANATDRVLLVNQQFASVLKNIGRAIAGQILTFGLLAGGAYLAFLAFDKFVLQNETFKEILYSTIQGIGTLVNVIKAAFGNPFVLATSAVIGLTVAVNTGLLPTLGRLIATTLAGWAVTLATSLGGLATTLEALGFVGLATSASTAAIGVRALGIAMTQGTVASAEFLATNGITVSGLFGLTAATGGATTGFATFATAIGVVIGELVTLLAPVLAVGAAIALIGLSLYSLQLKDSTEATEILAQATERLSSQALQTAGNLKKASDIQAEADKRGVRLSDEQYKANQRLVNQANLQKGDLTSQLVDLRSQLNQAVGDANKGNIQAQIADLESRIKLLDGLVGSVKIKPIDLERLGSGYEQLAKSAAAAEEAILKSSGDKAIFKQKSEELLSATEKQAEVGQISALEAIRRYNLVATNAFASQELQQKAQEAITAAFKRESDKRVGIVQAEQAAIAAQLANGKVEYEKSATAIADVQNSVLKSRLQAEQEAHQTKLAQIQKEFDNQIFVNKELLRQKEEAANIEAAKNADKEASLRQITQAELNRVKEAIAANEKAVAGNRFASQDVVYIAKQNELKVQQVQLESEIEASKARQAQQEDTAKNKPAVVDFEGRKALNDKIVQLEKDKNAALASETTKNARTNSELNNQIANNEAAANKLAADLRVKVRTGAISQELAAERLLTFAKKIELETQLRNINDTYTSRRKTIEDDFANTTKTLEDAISKKQAEADKLPGDSKEYEAAQADITLNNTKLINATKAKNSALLLAEQNYKVDVAKNSADVQKNQADSAEKESAIALKILDRNQKKALDAVQKAQNERIIQVQQLENKGLLDHTEVEEKKTEASKTNIAAQLNEERLRLKALQALPKPKNQEKGVELDAQIRASQLKVQDLVKSSLDAELKLYHDHIAVVVGNIKDEDTIRETQLENQSRRGLVSQNQVAEELARRKVASLEKEYALETKDASKRIELASQIEKAKTDLQNKRIATVLGNIKDEDTVREAQLESQARRGLIVQSQVNEELARRKVASLEKELVLEVGNTSKRKELALQIEKAKTALLDAEIKTRQEKLELQNQELKNQIDEQNQAIKRQGDLYGILTKALEQRNKLQEIARDLDKAGNDYVLGELEVLSSIERSEYRKKELAEITASIKLRSLTRQQEFEKQSLLNQIQQNQLALEQEAIQNRIAQGEKVAAIAGVRADIAIAQADPRNNTEAGRAKIEALQVKLQAEIDGFTNLQAEAGLIVKKADVQNTSNKAQLEQLGLKQDLDRLKARAELANALPPGKREQAGREIGQEIAGLFGQKNIQGLYNAGIAQSRSLANKEFGTSTRPDILGAINPNLGGILDQVGGGVAAAAIADTVKSFTQQFGNTENITGALTTGVAKAPLKTPDAVVRSQTLVEQIQKQLNEPISLPDGASLKLPSPAERGTFLSLENSGKLFNEGIDKLLAYLKDQSASTKKGSTYNIKVDGGQKSATATGSASEVSLENVLNYAKQMAGAY